jgi:hypothetical protein
VRPRIVASTATVRRADKQIRALFTRSDVEVFPPPGPDRKNSFFARTVPAHERHARRYVGIAAQGRSLKVLLMRTYLALLAAAQKAYAEAGGAKNRANPADPYMTVLGYFNALRELGGSRRIIEDEVSTRVADYGSRLRVGEADGCFASRKIAHEVLELTSREPTNRVADAKRRLALPFHDEEHVDVALATNMISVGLDITRLGLMVVLGQPKASAEYIQATSRVGRRWPGLIVVLFNAARSRDRSHYESFRAFHSALYRQVESSSVTPYSPRAIDRALHAVLVGLARLLLPSYGGNEGAAAIRDHRDQLERVVAIVRARARAVEPEQADAVDGEAERIVEQWATAADDEEAIVYANRYRPGAALLVDASDHESDPDAHFRTLWSLRDVDTESNLYLVRE